LQTEIWRGRILRAVRDREKNMAGWWQWISQLAKRTGNQQSQAYSMIQLANSADTSLNRDTSIQLLSDASANGLY